MFGGFNVDGPLRDLWLWDGTTWRELDHSGPVSTEGPVLVDAAESLMLVGAGLNAAGTGRAPVGVWQWRTERWIPVPASGPPGTVGQALAYDRARHAVVLWGGVVGGAGASPTIWELKAAIWHKVLPKAIP